MALDTMEGLSKDWAHNNMDNRDNRDRQVASSDQMVVAAVADGFSDPSAISGSAPARTIDAGTNISGTALKASSPNTA